MKTNNVTNVDNKNEIFKEELKTSVVEYLTKIERIKEYNIEEVANYLNKLRMLDNIFYGKNNKSMDYVLHYFEKTPKPELIAC